jgi:Zn ribbon nucleic-acid-binding protein/transposase-like protein
VAGLLKFQAEFGTEEQCLDHLVKARWPNGFVCLKCDSNKAWRLKTRPRVLECVKCGHQESVTAGTVFHRSQTALPKWFLAAYLMGRDKRGVSATFLQRELGIAYQTAWTIAHKIRHGLSEKLDVQLGGYLDADETFIGGRRHPEGRGRSLKPKDKSFVVMAIQKVEPQPRKSKKSPDVMLKVPHAVRRQQGFVAGDARIAVLPGQSGEELVGFIKTHVEQGSRLLTDGFPSYTSEAEKLSDYVKHTAIPQGAGKNAAVHFPIIHTVFSNIKSWLVGTHHGVSKKHLPRYLREWNYRFNRRRLIGRIDTYLIHRAVQCPTITYRELVGGAKLSGGVRRRPGDPIQLALPLTG